MDRRPFQQPFRSHGGHHPVMDEAAAPARGLPPMVERRHPISPVRGPMLNSNDGRSDFQQNRLPPIQEPPSLYRSSIPRPYSGYGDSERYDPYRRGSSSVYAPAGMVSAGYAASRRSPGPVSAAAYPSLHVARHSDAYGYEAHPGFGPSRRPLPPSFDAPGYHTRPTTEADLVPVSTPVKRPRVSLACLACRNRKSRCDGVRPTCKTCAHMKIDCKWPEVDFRRAKTGDASRQRRKSSGGPSSEQRSPETPAAHAPPTSDSANSFYTRSELDRGSLPHVPRSASQSAPHFQTASAPGLYVSGLASSPSSSRLDSNRINSGGEERIRDGDALPRIRSPTHRFGGVTSAAQDLSDGLHRAPPLSHNASVAQDTHHMRARYVEQERWGDYRPSTSPPEQKLDHRHSAASSMPKRIDQRLSGVSLLATKCRARAAQLSVLARPPSDAYRRAVEAAMARESSLDDLGDVSDPGERLERAFASDWDALGRLTSASRRPFMDVASGILGIVEIREPSRSDQNERVSSAACRLHVFRMKRVTNDPLSKPDLRHCSIALDLSSADEQELRQRSSSFDTLTYPMPVDRLAFPLTAAVRRTLAALESVEAAASRDSNKIRSPSPLHSGGTKVDGALFTDRSEARPTSHVTELFFRAFVDEIGEQMPGLEIDVVLRRIRDEKISPLLANALCCIGASLYERAKLQPQIPDTLSSEAYLIRARALIGSALCTDDVETILALGVMCIRDILVGLMTSAAAIISSAMRMCMQLDLHRARSPRYSAPEGEFDESTVFWMVYCLDRVMALNTARPVTIKDQDIDLAFPPTMHKSEPCIFSALVRQLHYAGRFSDVACANERSSRDPDRELAQEQELAAIESDIVGHYESLPAALRLSNSNLRRAYELGQPLSFLQLHLTYFASLITRFLLGARPMTEVEYDSMRMAAREIGEICMLSEALDGKSMSESPLSSRALFLAGCVSLAEIELLSVQADEFGEARPGLSPPSNSARNVKLQLDAAQSNLTRLLDTLGRQAKYWPAARANLRHLREQMTDSESNPKILQATLLSVVNQVEAVQIIVRRPQVSSRPVSASSPAVAESFVAEGLVKVQRVTSLDKLSSVFPHLF
ncbi:hypothetical protein BCV70DRAFT_75060 [Testicularia cyperi]|uniref:Zn(2)-C6 fungal-type domain-containing protein n=1 Tax=Testicularia cyperi TaxID=1882483 RepID=A0A317XTB0_9BASI|nr:hypothetical protein BCV70DRAFT_75060 [Testicularia cyperi]